AANDLSSCIQPAYFDDPQPPVELPQLTIDLAAVKARKPRNHHPELAAVADSGLIPPHLDRRGESDRITEHVLRQAERLGVVRLV
ncbi:MAG: phosphoesterase, partial [Myxococcales bacterium]|nr:phosphoesterase [Myxococcales bacterium]